ncbi:MAG: GDSL-type esterase/lipase family protein [Aggregatilineales bacterium]
MKIVFFGDSLTWGGYGGSYFDALARYLPGVERVNAGAGGDTVINLLRRLDEDVIAQQPEAVFVMVGSNDAIAYSQPDTRPYYRQTKALSHGFVAPGAFEQTYRELLIRLQLEHIQVWVGLPPAEYNSDVVAALEAFNARTSRVARALAIPTLDLLAEFRPATLPHREPLRLGDVLLVGRRIAEGWHDYASAQTAGGFTFTFDGLHFTPEAAERAAAKIAAFILA